MKLYYLRFATKLCGKRVEHGWWVHENSLNTSICCWFWGLLVNIMVVVRVDWDRNWQEEVTWTEITRGYFLIRVALQVDFTPHTLYPYYWVAHWWGRKRKYKSDKAMPGMQKFLWKLSMTSQSKEDKKLQ